MFKIVSNGKCYEAIQGLVSNALQCDARVLSWDYISDKGGIVLLPNSDNKNNIFIFGSPTRHS